MPWDEFRYAAYARRFGWPPPVVDELPLALESWLLPIADALDQEDVRRENAAVAKAQKQNKTKG